MRLDRETFAPSRLDIAAPFRGDGVANALRDVYGALDASTPRPFADLLERIDTASARGRPVTVPY